MRCKQCLIRQNRYLLKSNYFDNRINKVKQMGCDIQLKKTTESEG